MKKGLTLAEVLLGMVILVFAFVAVLALFANCIILNESNRNLTIAVSHAQFVMEEIKDTPYSIISSGDWDWDTAQIGTEGLNALTNESITTTIIETTRLDVVVKAEWDDRGGRTRDIKLQTLITEP